MVIARANASSPIGVFDSGIGGLTVVRELMRQLPDERIIYFGDTARVPYGPKSPDTVRRYAREIATWLQHQGVKSIVVACNTATAHALETLTEEFSFPILGVVEPGARAAVRASHGRSIGVIGTAGTIGSGAYERAIRKLAPQARIAARACPLFVPLVEEGWLDRDATRLIADEYLGPLRREEVDTLVLGCTHYPLLKSLIGDVMGRDVQLIDSAQETAAETARVLEGEGLRANGDLTGPHRFVASDAPEQFLRMGQRFLGTTIDCVETVTLG
jgi:glutamate racemase